jgi:hypothetical protein
LLDPVGWDSRKFTSARLEHRQGLIEVQACSRPGF